MKYNLESHAVPYLIAIVIKFLFFCETNYRSSHDKIMAINLTSRFSLNYNQCFSSSLTALRAFWRLKF